MRITIDTYQFVRFLSEKKHFTPEQAETLVEAAVDFNNEVAKDIATKGDLKELSSAAKSDMKDMYLKLGGLVVGCTTVLGFVLGILVIFFGK